jgi:hypothetical protein
MKPGAHHFRASLAFAWSPEVGVLEMIAVLEAITH